MFYFLTGKVESSNFPKIADIRINNRFTSHHLNLATLNPIQILAYKYYDTKVFQRPKPSNTHTSHRPTNSQSKQTFFRVIQTEPEFHVALRKNWRAAKFAYVQVWEGVNLRSLQEETLVRSHSNAIHTPGV